MIYRFDTFSREAATAALLVYAVWRSRDRRRFKVTPELWGQIERFTKASAKRASTLPRFLDTLKPRLACDTIHPRAMEFGLKGDLPVLAVGNGVFVQSGASADERPEQREFLTTVLAEVDHRTVLDLLYRETSWVILLVRDRLERERFIEERFAAFFAIDEAWP